MLEHYQGDGSVCARKVRLTLAEKGITDWVGHCAFAGVAVYLIPKTQFEGKKH